MNEQHRPPALQKKPRGWMDRNWKWFIPLLVVGSGAVMVAFFVAIFAFVFSLMKSSDVYKEAYVRAVTDPEVQAALGGWAGEALLVEGRFVSGNINTSGSSGEADLAIPISGPNGQATIYVVANKSAGAWNFSSLVVEIRNTGERINLLE